MCSYPLNHPGLYVHCEREGVRLSEALYAAVSSGAEQTWTEALPFQLGPQW